MIDHIVLTGTTNASGAKTITAPIPTPGALLHAVQWIDGDLADGVDAVLSTTAMSSGVDYTLLTLTDANADAWYYPRTLVHDLSGGALTGTAGGDRARPVIAGTLKLVISSGGDTKTGGCVVYFER